MSAIHTASSSTSRITAARVAGISSLVMAAAAGFAEMGARQALIVPTDAALTAQNILGHATTFDIGLLCYGIVLICDLLAAWAYGAFFSTTHSRLSKLAAWLRVVYTVVFALAISYLLRGQIILGGSEPDAPTRALQAFASFEDIWQIAFLFFSGHLILLGYLALRSRLVPKILGVLLLAAGIGYGLHASAYLLLPTYASYKPLLTALSGIPSVLGEIGMAIWLLALKKEKLAISN